MIKRVVLFLAVNALVVLTISVTLSLFGIGPYINWRARGDGGFVLHSPGPRRPN